MVPWRFELPGVKCISKTFHSFSTSQESVSWKFVRWSNSIRTVTRAEDQCNTMLTFCMEVYTSFIPQCILLVAYEYIGTYSKSRQPAPRFENSVSQGLENKVHKSCELWQKKQQAVGLSFGSTDSWLINRAYFCSVSSFFRKTCIFFLSQLNVTTLQAMIFLKTGL